MDKINVDWGVIFNYSPKGLLEVAHTAGMEDMDINIIYLFLITFLIMLCMWGYNTHIYFRDKGRVPTHSLGHIELGFMLVLVELGFAWWFFFHPFTRVTHWEPVQYWVHLIHDYKGEGLEWVALMASFLHLDFTRHIWVTLKRGGNR